jgi:hypothetical protein
MLVVAMDYGNCRCAAAKSAHLEVNQIGRSLRQRLWLNPVFGREVFALHVAKFSHTPLEGRIQMRDIRHIGQIADHRHRRILRVARERPYRRADNNRYELTPSHCCLGTSYRPQSSTLEAA